MEPIGKAGKHDRRWDARKLQLLHDIRRILVIAALVIAAFCLIFGFSRVSGISMLDTLQDGELVGYIRFGGAPARGSIVSVRIPSGEYYVKRVVAVAGDTVDLRDGVLYINGQPEHDAWAKNPTLAEEGPVTYPLTVPQDHVFVLGDNRPQSIDSRAFGCVSVSQVRGRVCFSLAGLSLRFH